MTISFLIVNLIENGITGASIKNPIRDYTYTKAICDGYKCQDYIIKCKGETLISKTPITGAVIEIDSNFKDPRAQEIINKNCTD